MTKKTNNIDVNGYANNINAKRFFDDNANSIIKHLKKAIGQFDPTINGYNLSDYYIND